MILRLRKGVVLLRDELTEVAPVDVRSAALRWEPTITTISSGSEPKAPLSSDEVGT